MKDSADHGPITLERLQKILGGSVLKAPLLINRLGTNSRVESVALRTDRDGTVSIVLYDVTTPSRTKSKEANAVRDALRGWAECVALAPELRTGEKPDEVFYTIDLMAALMVDAGVELPQEGDVFEELQEFIEKLKAAIPKEAESGLTTEAESRLERDLDQDGES